MPKILDTYCDICNEVGETRYFDLFTIGSEGTRLCHDCEMLVVEFISDKRRSAMQNRMREHMKAKEK